VVTLKTRLAGILILTFILHSALMFSAHGIHYQEVNATISEAEQALATGFEAALDAEEAGANVSSLLVKLNEGGAYFSAARMAFEDGNFSEADRLSGLSYSISVQVESDAQILKAEAINAAFNRFRLYLTSSAVAMVIVVVATFFGYRLLKKRYFKRLLDMKPEVRET
jgi:hypothetical protein